MVICPALPHVEHCHWQQRGCSSNEQAASGAFSCLILAWVDYWPKHLLQQDSHWQAVAGLLGSAMQLFKWDSYTCLCSRTGKEPAASSREVTV